MYDETRRDERDGSLSDVMRMGKSNGLDWTARDSCAAGAGRCAQQRNMLLLLMPIGEAEACVREVHRPRVYVYSESFEQTALITKCLMRSVFAYNLYTQYCKGTALHCNCKGHCTAKELADEPTH